MIIAQISDSHIDPESDRLHDRLNDLRCVVDDLNNLDPAPDIVIHTGDVVHNGSQEKYDLALTILGDLRVPLYACAGNRDDRDLIPKNFQTGSHAEPDSGFLQYSINDYPVRLIALDTLCATSNMGDYCAARADELNRILAEEPHQPTVLFMHHPPFEIVESLYPFQFDDWHTVEHLVRVLAQHNQVKQLFCGHTHRLSRGTIHGIAASTVPSIAVDLRFGELPAGTQLQPVYQLHTFDGKGFNSATMVCSTKEQAGLSGR